MKQQSKDPFEAAFEEQDDSPPDSPAAFDAIRAALDEDYDEGLPPEDPPSSSTPSTAAAAATTTTTTVATVTPATKTLTKKSSAKPTPASSARATKQSQQNKEEDDDEDEDNVDVELGKYPATGDPVKMAKMQAILSRFSEEQMSRYESFRRAGFQKSNMKRLLASISGTPKISVPMTIVVSGIAKMFVGELVETARMVMSERRESGPIRPCHIRESYRRLKLEGKVPKRSVSRLFR
ncbi:putative transcription factor Hap3/NF-YB family [Rosa chinensis]|uniref:Putative transcription factor Hap3/NF-YB family n=1 Tax=Rosa chinensis TaxID=74649 RepID=A0A2P6Q7P8_ROSCH|nr:transcription initiation factor TFIID subunit 11 [Rosa chinensis]XP_024161221.1 transcription initiation factor TFIID subunit 11 [Rosa chinensis]XP_024161222.1 transcription initiation factor TFIID subunit 11 [Rosa chinensis]XP_024161223.1 transcription initiation factor TFIID subunit 11 [Rosa chinensis]XP_024161224.1 transcription initiation factor TFIID subunit 11 [Rosa chinensis]PRQ30213.1 putative transcription factor Hap3/NF-YB family [Rosa chinensis]